MQGSRERTTGPILTLLINGQSTTKWSSINACTAKAEVMPEIDTYADSIPHVSPRDTTNGRIEAKEVVAPTAGSSVDYTYHDLDCQYDGAD
jgi:hypothetical protein